MKKITSYIAKYEQPSGQFTEGRLVDNSGDDQGSEVTSRTINDLLYAVYACIDSWKSGGVSNTDESSLNSDFMAALLQKFVDTDTDQIISGIKTLTAIPLLPAVNPTQDNQAVSKAYVDAIKEMLIGQQFVAFTEDQASALAARGALELNGATVPNGAIDYPLLAAACSEWVSGDDLILPVKFANSLADETKRETINRISTNNGSWTVDRDGYVYIGMIVPSSNGISVILNGIPVAEICYITNGGSVYWTIKVQKGDIVKISASGYVSCYCYWEPAKGDRIFVISDAYFD
jgi:hypothetical protein